MAEVLSMASDATEGSVPQETREAVLERDQYRCQACGATGISAGGHTPLQVHHIQEEPDHCGYDDPANLITLCQPDHVWFHHRSTREDTSVELSDAAAGTRLSQDYEILELLETEGPQSLTEIQHQIAPSLTKQNLRQRLWVLMGLDNAIEEQDEQLIDHDAVTGDWGRPSDIAVSERGRIPDDVEELNRRIEDERIRRWLADGSSREAVAEKFGVSWRAVWYKQHRARAYEFPLDDLDLPVRGSTPDHPPDQADRTDPQTAVDPVTETDADPHTAPAMDPEATEGRTTASTDADRESDVLADRSGDETTRLDAQAADAEEAAETTARDADMADDAAETISAPVEILADEDPHTPDYLSFQEASADADDDPKYHRVLLTVGVEDLNHDAILRYCIQEGKPLQTVLEEWILQGAGEVFE
jgi:hypothetical protein